MNKSRGVSRRCLLCVLLAFPATSSAAQTPVKAGTPGRALLRAEVSESGKVGLSWRVSKWGKHLLGFELKRRHETTDGQWSEWKRVGSCPVQPNLPSLLKRQKVPHAPEGADQWGPEEAVRWLQSDADAFKKLLALCDKKPYLSSACGLGQIDGYSPTGKLCEYRLSEVIDHPTKGRIVGKQLDEMRLRAAYRAFPCPPLEELKAVRTASRQVSVSFKVEKKVLDADRGAVGFVLLRAGLDEPIQAEPGGRPGRYRHRFRALRKTCDAVLSKDGKWYTFTITDTVSDPLRRKYAVALMRGGGVQGQPSRRVMAGPPKEPVRSPTAVDCRAAEDGMVVSWTYEGKEEDISGFHVTRHIVVKKPDKKLELETELLPPGARSWTDRTARAQCGGKLATYTVTAVSGDYRGNREVSTKMTRIPCPKPPPPTHFRARVELAKASAVIVCEWDAVQSEGVYSYRVDKYSPNVKSWRSFAWSKTNQCKKDVGPYGGIAKLRVVALAGGNQQSVPSYPVTVKYPRGGKPFVQDVVLKGTKRGDGSFLLTWNGPKSKDIRGFRIAQDGKTIAAESLLGPHVRQFVISDVPETMPRYDLYAIGAFGEVSDAARHPPRRPAKITGVGNRDVRKATKVVIDNPRHGQKDKIYSRTEFLQWEDGHKVRHGTVIYYREDGTIKNKHTYRLGKIHGVSRSYDATGALTHLGFHLNGRLLSAQTYVNEEGQGEFTDAEVKWLKEEGKLYNGIPVPESP